MNLHFPTNAFFTYLTGILIMFGSFVIGVRAAANVEWLFCSEAIRTLRKSSDFLAEEERTLRSAEMHLIHSIRTSFLKQSSVRVTSSPQLAY